MAVEVNPFASDPYRDLLRAKHAEKRWGAAGASWAPEVHAFALKIGAQTILDYGCGRGTLAAALAFPFNVAEYDPGIEGKDALPEPADLVVCTDVLEHVEPDRIEAVIAHIHSLARKGAFLLIACSPSRAMLPDGRNSHLIIEQPEWWIRTLGAQRWAIKSERRKGLCVWLTK